MAPPGDDQARAGAQLIVDAYPLPFLERHPLGLAAPLLDGPPGRFPEVHFERRSSRRLHVRCDGRFGELARAYRDGRPIDSTHAVMGRQEPFLAMAPSYLVTHDLWAVPDSSERPSHAPGAKR
jgi:hypothetical protein